MVHGDKIAAMIMEWGCEIIYDGLISCLIVTFTVNLQ